MTQTSNSALKIMQHYVTDDYPCPYRLGYIAQAEVIPPLMQLPQWEFDRYLQNGFRRNGQYIYRQACLHCTACISLRVCCQSFQANRSQKRAARLLSQLEINILAPRLTQEYFALYCKYQLYRHTDTLLEDGMPEAKQFQDFLVESPCQTQFVEFRRKGVLLAVSVIDKMHNGLSAVYTFYDPAWPKFSLGTVAILYLIAYCQKQQLDYLYLGYWIESSEKMQYKTRFSPYELFINGQWQNPHTPSLTHSAKAHKETLAISQVEQSSWINLTKKSS